MDQFNPYFELDQDALAQTCEARVQELQTRAWSTPAERDALREQTALLLDAAARRLAEDSLTTGARTCANPRFQLADFLDKGAPASYVDVFNRVEAQLAGSRPFVSPIEPADTRGS